MVALAYVNYGLSVVGGKATAQNLMKKVLAAATDYVAVDQPWKVLHAWRQHEQHLITKAKSILEQGLLVARQAPAGHRGSHGAQLRPAPGPKRHRALPQKPRRQHQAVREANPLSMPNESPKSKLRFPYMLSAVARMVIRDWSALQQRLDQAVE